MTILNNENPGIRIVPRLTRRSLLVGMAAAGGAAALTSLGYRRWLGSSADTTQEKVPFWGIHQAGITTAAPAAALIAAFDITAKNKAELIELFKTLTDRIEKLTQGWTPPAENPQFPPPDSGVLGTKVFPDNLTVTVSVGASLFDRRYGLEDLKPRHLQLMPNYPNDQLNPDEIHGDLLLQFCSNTAETNIHALRDILKNTPAFMTPRWKMEGFLPPHTIKKLGRDTVRNLLGFKDGTANLNANDDKQMNHLVWVTPENREPEWATGGSYQVVRIVRNLVERWDRTPLREQEQVIGRTKDTGAPLGMKREHDIPSYDADPKGHTIPLDAHIRLANPRKSDLGLILRRGFNYSRGMNAAGQLDMGLLFVCFQADLQRGFITVQERLNGEPLEEYIKPLGGGFFFALPGIKTREDYLGRSLLESA